MVGNRVQRQHGERDFEENLRLLGGGEKRAVEHDAKHGDERHRHRTGVTLPAPHHLNKPLSTTRR
jgi:hypothetical protein